MKVYTRSRDLEVLGPLQLNLSGGVLTAPFSVHGHDFYELLIIFGGGGVHRMGHREWVVSRGDIFVIPPGTAHGFPVIDRLDLFNVMFDPEEMGTRWDSLRRTPGYLGLFQIEPMLRRTPGSAEDAANRVRLHLYEDDLETVARLKLLLEEAFAGHRVDPVDSLLHVLCWFLADRFAETGTGMRSDDMLPLARGTAYLKAGRDNPELSITQAASAAGLSPRHFTRLFSAAYGRGPRRYLLELRLERAARLLKETGLSVTEIAYACGFNDGNYFSRIFKTRTGCSPRDYRKK